MQIITVNSGDIIHVGDDVTVSVKDINGEIYIEVDAQEVKVQENNMLELSLK